MRTSWILITLLILLAPLASEAKDVPCTDGVDCYCDRARNPNDALYRPDVVWCEDFEHPNLPQYSGRGEWHNLYSTGVAGCTDDSSDVNQYRSGMGQDGDHDCMDIVDEVTPTFQNGGCGVSGESDCVFDGIRSLGHRARPRRQGGIVGDARWNGGARSQFGLTMAIRWSNNYLAPGDPGCSSTSAGECGPAHKMNEFGENAHALLGATLSSGGRNHPFIGAAFTSSPASARSTVGTVTGAGADTGFTYFTPDRSLYEWKRDLDVGQWACLSMHWSGWGTGNTRLRYWINGTKVIDGTTDTSQLYQNKDQNGIGSMVFNNYYNGPPTPGTFNPDGYPGATVAYRYEDNLVVTSGSEPVSCAEIGFDGTFPAPAPAPPPIDGTLPQQPFLLP